MNATDAFLARDAAISHHADRLNENQGAESTLALLSTLQHARALALTGS